MIIKKAEPLLTLPEGQISLYEMYDISGHIHGPCGNHGAHQALLPCVPDVSIPADNSVDKVLPNFRDCGTFRISADDR